jgi:hypothetical protein
MALREWLIQCKKAIGPAKLKGHLGEISLAPEERLYGVIVAAACDSSKASRDAFFTWCREHGISEAHIRPVPANQLATYVKCTVLPKPLCVSLSNLS